MRTFSRSEARDLLSLVDRRQKSAFDTMGYRWVYAADEFYLMTGRDIPEVEIYDDFPQVENGIGIARLFIDEIHDWLAQETDCHICSGKTYLITSPLAALVLTSVLPAISEYFECDFELMIARNSWLGGAVTVAGLLAGSDIIDAINTARPTGRVLLPDICLNPDGVFLDDLSVDAVIKATGAQVTVVPSTGWDFMEALAGVTQDAG